MKLLDKKKIASDFNDQKKAQVDEGVRIAKQVDILREELASLEHQREVFLAGSKLELTKATGVLLEKIETLKGEIKKLEEKKEELRKPLDDAWAKLTEDLLALQKDKDEFKTSEYELSKEKKRIEKATERLTARENEFAENGRAIAKLNIQAQQLKDEAERINASAKHEYGEQTRKFTEANAELAKKQRQADIDAKDNERVRKVQEKRELDLNNREKAIDDKYQTLLRTIKRVKP